MSRNVMLRLLESFFRRWYLYLLPVVLLAGFGARSALTSKATYQSGGTINVASTTLLSTLSDVRDNTNFGIDTPAESTSKQLNALLQTDQFASKVASSAGLDAALASGLITLNDVRSSVGAAATGANLVKISASSIDPTLPPKLVTATIGRFTDAVVDSQVSDSTAAQSFYDQLAKQYKTDVDAARNELDTYLVGHPAPTPPLLRPDEEQLDIARLNGNLTQAQDRYNGALDKSLSAKLSIQQATADVGQRLRLVDPPDASFRQSRLKKSIFTVAIFLTLGILLAIGTVVIGTVMDQSFRTAADVQDRLGLRVLGVVPDAERGRRKAKGKKKKQAEVPAGVPERAPSREVVGVSTLAITAPDSAPEPTKAGDFLAAEDDGEVIEDDTTDADAADEPAAQEEIADAEPVDDDLDDADETPAAHEGDQVPAHTNGQQRNGAPTSTGAGSHFELGGVRR